MLGVFVLDGWYLFKMLSTKRWGKVSMVRAITVPEFVYRARASNSLFDKAMYVSFICGRFHNSGHETLTVFL